MSFSTQQIAARYRPAGRFARHYVAGKLRHDPFWPALHDLATREKLGDVVDIGCGRGQFAAALLQAGLAHSVLGIDVQRTHLEQARAAMLDLAFSTRWQDFSIDPSIPVADTIMIVDVLYQLEGDVQAAMLRQAAEAARKTIILRTCDPDIGLRSKITRAIEGALRPVWPHAGRHVNACAVSNMVAILENYGMECTISPCWSGTPFSNVLIVATKPPSIGCAARIGSEGTLQR